MIFNRTQLDVDNAIKIREEKIKTFQKLTESDISILERGMLTFNTLNRIENKQQELKELFSSIGYWNTNLVANRTWSDHEEVFTKEDFQRIIDNENILRNAFFVYSDTPNTPTISFGYEDINSLEKILYDLENMISVVKSSFKECGTFECGVE